MNQKLIIIRGLPGSSKTTTAQTMIKQLTNEGFRCSHFEADMFFTEGGNYHYVRDLIPNAHEWCYQNIVKSLLIDRYDYVFVSNTFTRHSEYQRYINLCQQHNIEYEVLLPTTPWAWDVDECFKKNRHNVPYETIQKMKDRFEY